MKSEMRRREFLQGLGVAASLAAVSGRSAAQPRGKRPNIVWIVAEDASPHLGCYGETTINTPHLDQMAAEGVRFDAAFVTCPVCSPCRSAMVSGMYQTTLGAHHHRSQSDAGKGAGHKDYFSSYKLPIKLVPELFRDAGYFVTLGSKPSCQSFGKTDYNFIWEQPAAYDGADWRERPKDKPFFAQIMLSGGKNRGGSKKHATNPDDVKLPPYYPDHPQLREDWAEYLNTWIEVDHNLRDIHKSLEAAGVAENTVVFFWTDHGVSHLRGKQFLYEEGVRVPLIVRFPDKRAAGTTREDLVLHIDVAASSLALAGIAKPGHVQGVDLFADDYRPRTTVFSARDRCDETPDTIRCARTRRYKYIRNFLAHMPHAQPNQYKDGKDISKTMHALYREGKLNELQARIFSPKRPPEELYDLENDPYETVNLAGKPEVAAVQKQLREELYDWMAGSRDLGLIPEPILEDLGKQHGNKYFVLQQPENKDLVRQLIEVIEAGERGHTQALRAALKSKNPALRYWAVTGAGNLDGKGAVKALTRRNSDPDPAVRIAAALALCKLGEPDGCAEILIKEIDNANYIASMYALRAIEIAELDTPSIKAAVNKAQEHPYEFTRRIAKRLTGKFSA